MEKTENKYIAVDYCLYSVADGKKELVEQTSAERPFVFITGFGIALDAFEKTVESLAAGEEFDFNLGKEEAFGDRDERRVISLDKEMFDVDGHFDKENIFVGATIPLQNEDGNRFMGVVLEIGKDKVRIDLNSPLAGKTLNFTGKVLENRAATSDEIQSLVNHLNGGCGGGCGKCGGSCGHDGEKKGDGHDGGCGHYGGCH